MDKFVLGRNEGGVENVVWFDEPTGMLYCADIQSGAVNQKIIDENALWRATERDDRPNAPGSQGKKIASIPITLWQAWRFEWMRRHRDRWTWQTFELMQLAKPEHKAFLTTNKTIPRFGPRDRPVMA